MKIIRRLSGLPCTTGNKGEIMYRILMCAVAALFIGGQAVAQQKQHVSYKNSAENSKFIVSQNVDIGDIPNHIVRIFEIRRTFPNNAPVINGLKIVEEWDRGVAELIDGNGSAVPNYTIYVMENGDKFFTRIASLLQTTPDGKFTVTTVGYITGGTGKLAGIQGTTRGSGNIDLKTNFNESQIDIEYSIGK
jgi:hypothetical protein